MDEMFLRYFGQRLHERFDSTIAEPVPKSWLDLLHRLDKHENNPGAGKFAPLIVARWTTDQG
jgi:hypothetical protein